MVAVGISAAMLSQQFGPSRGFREDFPDQALTGRVTDAASVLAAAQTVQLTVLLEKLEHETGHQLVVATVPSLHGEDIATFTRRHANAWGVGRAGYNDGVVVLLAPTERKVRIAVGYGLEHVLTNARCDEIIRQHMVPYLSRGDLSGGLASGVAELDAALRRSSGSYEPNGMADPADLRRDHSAPLSYIATPCQPALSSLRRCFLAPGERHYANRTRLSR